MSETKKDLIFEIEKKLLDNCLIKEQYNPEIRSIKLSPSEFDIKDDDSGNNSHYEIANPTPVYGYPNIPGLQPYQASSNLIPKFISEPNNTLENDSNIFFEQIRNSSYTTLNSLSRIWTDLQLMKIAQVSTSDQKKEAKGFREIFNGPFPKIELDHINMKSDLCININSNICDQDLLFISTPSQNELPSFIPNGNPLFNEEFISIDDELLSANMTNVLGFSRKQ